MSELKPIKMPVEVWVITETKIVFDPQLAPKTRRGETTIAGVCGNREEVYKFARMMEEVQTDNPVSRLNIVMDEDEHEMKWRLPMRRYRARLTVVQGEIE